MESRVLHGWNYKHIMPKKGLFVELSRVRNGKNGTSEGTEKEWSGSFCWYEHIPDLKCPYFSTGISRLALTHNSFMTNHSSPFFGHWVTAMPLDCIFFPSGRSRRGLTMCCSVGFVFNFNWIITWCSVWWESSTSLWLMKRLSSFKVTQVCIFGILSSFTSSTEIHNMKSIE